MQIFESWYQNVYFSLRKGFYPHDYMDDREKVNEKSSEKQDLYSYLNMENITDADYRHTYYKTLQRC